MHADHSFRGLGLGHMMYNVSGGPVVDILIHSLAEHRY